MLTVDIGLAKIVHLDNHLKVEVVNALQDLLIDVKTRIINLEDKFLAVTLHKEDLSLTRIVAQRADFVITDSLQHEGIFRQVICIGYTTITSDCSIS